MLIRLFSSTISGGKLSFYCQVTVQKQLSLFTVKMTFNRSNSNPRQSFEKMLEPWKQTLKGRHVVDMAVALAKSSEKNR